MKWRKHVGSTPGSLEAYVSSANPVEPEFPIKIRATIHAPYEGRKDFFTIVILDIGTKTELIRIYDKDVEKAKTAVEEGLVKMFSGLLEAVKRG